MKTEDITGQIKAVTDAIDKLSLAQSFPMTTQIRLELGREINCLYCIIQEMAQEYRTRRD